MWAVRQDYAKSRYSIWIAEVALYNGKVKLQGGLCQISSDSNSLKNVTRLYCQTQEKKAYLQREVDYCNANGLALVLAVVYDQQTRGSTLQSVYVFMNE